VYGPSPSCLVACWRTAFFATLGLGTESSAGFGDVLLAWGGLELNLDEMLENQDPLLWGDAPGGGCFRSSVLFLLMGVGGVGVEIGFVGETVEDGVVWLPLTLAAVEAGESTGGLPAGVPSRDCCECDLCLEKVFATLSLGLPWVIQLTSTPCMCSMIAIASEKRTGPRVFVF